MPFTFCGVHQLLTCPNPKRYYTTNKADVILDSVATQAAALQDRFAARLAVYVEHSTAERAVLQLAAEAKLKVSKRARHFHSACAVPSGAFGMDRTAWINMGACCIASATDV